MNIFTNGTQLSTAITNLFIALIAIYSYLNVRKSNNTWKYFFLTMTLCALFGFIIHGFLISENIIRIFWIILSFFFCIAISLLVTSIINELNNNKKVIIYIFAISICLFICMFVFILNNLNFLLLYIFYVLICLIIMTIIVLYLIFVKKQKHAIYYLLAIFMQIIGGLFLLNKSSYFKFIFEFDKNGIYHIFMIITIFLFYLGVRNKIENNFYDKIIDFNAK